MITGRTIMVTGGTGTFGKAFIRKLMFDYDPKKIIVFSRDELKQHEMRSEGYTDKSLRYFIGDVRDKKRLCRAMQGVDVIVHAAALKQVVSCEYNPFEAVKTNILGSQNLIEASIDTGVKRIIGVSSDKAVSPLNLYGGTKLVSERLFIQGNAYASGTNTRFCCVRYGNVMGSRGSVIPLFKSQKRNGELTITDERMTRFWITIEQAVDLVLKAIVETKGGEIYIPKIPSMKVVDLAEAIAPNCKLKIIGIRPGEKLHEVLINSEELVHTIEHNDKYIILPPHNWFERGHITGKPVKNMEIYSSDTNKQWLDVKEIKKLIRNIK
jgi:UDP-N-acetylglucosamine 4,6-dehydratase